MRKKMVAMLICAAMALTTAPVLAEEATEAERMVSIEKMTLEELQEAYLLL